MYLALVYPTNRTIYFEFLNLALWFCEIFTKFITCLHKIEIEVSTEVSWEFFISPIWYLTNYQSTVKISGWCQTSRYQCSNKWDMLVIWRSSLPFTYYLNFESNTYMVKLNWCYNATSLKLWPNCSQPLSQWKGVILKFLCELPKSSKENFSKLPQVSRLLVDRFAISPLLFLVHTFPKKLSFKTNWK